MACLFCNEKNQVNKTFNNEKSFSSFSSLRQSRNFIPFI